MDSESDLQRWLSLLRAEALGQEASVQSTTIDEALQAAASGWLLLRYQQLSDVGPKDERQEKSQMLRRLLSRVRLEQGGSLIVIAGPPA